jgi:glutathione S-transferase
MAINLYLAEKYGKAPSGPPAQISMRSLSMELWGMTEIDPLMAALVMKGIFLPPDQRDEKAVAQALERIKAPLNVLDDAVKGHGHMGNEFTIADLNVAAVMSFALLAKVDFSPVPAAQAWINKCVGREANSRVRALK